MAEKTNPNVKTIESPTTGDDTFGTTVNEEYDRDFMGKHFEGLGNAWEALFGDSDLFAQHLPTVVAQGTIGENGCVMYHDETIVYLLQYPDCQSSVRVGVLCVTSPNKDNIEVYSFYPVMEGLPNQLVITKRHTWTNGIEGVVAAECADNGPPASFFAPFYYREATAFSKGLRQTVYLAALAMSCEKAEQERFTIDKGPFFEMKLQEFLKENPRKTVNDFSAPVISMCGVRMLMPSQYVCEWEYRFPILAVEQTSFMDKPIYKLRIDFVGMDDQMLSGYFYVPETMLKGYIPKVGDDIQGVLWMTGTLG